MTLDPQHGHAALRRGRWSESGAQYFLTFCTDARKTGLTDPVVQHAILSGIEKLEDESAWRVRTATIMPDHLHLLVTLGNNSEIAGAVRLFKGRLSPVIRPLGLTWQKAYFDHRLRPHEDALPIFIYIFLNSYRAGLVGADIPWSGYYCCPEDWTWFQTLTDQSCPYPEWLV